MAFPFQGDEQPGDESQDDLSPEELREQLAAERAARQAAEEAREREQRRLDEMLRTPRQAEPAPEALRPLGPAPDPSEDFAAFQRWQAEKDRRAQLELEARLTRERDEIRQSVSSESRTQLLWVRFQQKYPRHATREALVRAAYVELTQRNALPASPEAAVDAVAREMDAIVGSPIDPTLTPGDRTAGTGEGLRGVPPRRDRKPAADEGHSSMHKAISSQQIKYGLL